MRNPAMGGMIWTGETEGIGEKTCPSGTLPTKNPTMTAVGANPGVHGVNAGG